MLRGTQRLGPCRVPVAKAILLYGAPGSGKTMLAHAMAHASAARTFNISPRNVDGRYAGKAVSLMVHMVITYAHVLPCDAARNASPTSPFYL